MLNAAAMSASTGAQSFIFPLLSPTLGSTVPFSTLQQTKLPFLHLTMLPCPMSLSLQEK